MSASVVQKNDNRYISLRFQLLLIIVTVLLAYYPAVSQELLYIDDVNIVESVGKHKLDLLNLFMPKAKDGLYYRPMLQLSFYADKYLFNLDAGFMHLENIILHGINALLVFWLSVQLSAYYRKVGYYIPLLSAIFFGLHPIATESVSWVSGRTDVIACLFVLLSANFLFLFKRSHLYGFLASSAFFMALGFLTKETALAFLPGALLIITAKDDGHGLNSLERRGALLFNLRKNAAIALGGLALLVFFFLLRTLAFVSNESRIGYTLQTIFLDGIQSTMVVLKSFAFYLKKFLFPFPLNFAIIEIDPLYELFGLPLFVAALVLLSQRTTRSAIFMTGVFLIVPAFLVAFNQLAWTPYAERYLYMPSAFVTAAGVFYASDLISRTQFRHKQKTAIFFAILLIVVMAMSTFQRNTIWKSNLDLFKDTTEKSPTFYVVRAEYARALTEVGDFKNARIQFEQARDESRRRVPSFVRKPFYSNRFGYWANADLGLAYILAREGKTGEAVEAYEKIFAKLPEGAQSLIVLGQIVSLYSDLLGNTQNPYDASKIKKKLSIYTKKLYILKRYPEAFFRLGKVSLMRGERKDALEYFRKAYDLYSENDAYKAITEKHIKRLKI